MSDDDGIEQNEPPPLEESPQEGPAEALAGAPDEAPAAPEDAEALAEAVPLVEALLFASPKPTPLDKLAEAAELPEPLIARAIDVLEAALGAEGRGIRLDRVAGGVRVVTRAEYDYPVRRLLGLDGKTKLSMAALETLAIVAYRQPITGPEIAELRSVNSSSSIRTLLDKKLITTAGRKEVVGTPFLYKTTKDFLVHFGLQALAGLPKPEELEAIYGLEPPPPPGPAQVELFQEEEPAGEAAAEAGADAGAGPVDAGEGPPSETAPEAFAAGPTPPVDEEVH